MKRSADAGKAHRRRWEAGRRGRCSGDLEGMPVGMAYAQELEGDSGEVGVSDLRLSNVRPDGERHFVDGLMTCLAAQMSDDPGYEFQIKEPGRDEGLHEDPGGQIPADELGTALGVVEGQFQKGAGCGGDKPAGIVAQRLPPDICSHPAYSGAADKLPGRDVPGRGPKVVDGLKRGGQVGVPVADIVGGCSGKGLENPQADRLRLTAVDRAVQLADPAAGLLGHGGDYLGGGVGAAVVDKEKADLRILGDEAHKGIREQTVSLVIAGNDDGQHISS